MYLMHLTLYIMYFYNKQPCILFSYEQMKARSVKIKFRKDKKEFVRSQN